jgi:iron uptake system component EfeO
MRPLPAIVSVLLAVLVVGACSSSARTAESTAAPSATRPVTADGEAAVSTYRAFLTSQAELLVAETRRLAAAIQAGDVAAAKAQYSVARAPYERIEPVAEMIDDLDAQIDAREGDVPSDEWLGFHRIERELWRENSMAGLAPVADQLVAAVIELQAGVQTVELSPSLIADTAVDLLNDIGTNKVTGEENRYARTDLLDAAASLSGAQDALRAVTPMVADRALVSELHDTFAEVQAALDRHRRADGYVAYTDLTVADTNTLGTQVDALADAVSAVPALVAVPS